MDKTASTALVRRIAQGALSPAAINRAASAMQPGKFRYLKTLGRGQFSLADEVVGNVGGQAGRMVRKVPTQALSSPAEEYAPLKDLSDFWNHKYTNSPLRRLTRAVTGAPKPDPPIAPFNAVTDKGGFQQLATGNVPKLPWGLKRKLGDQHAGNVGPKGQVIDFSVEGNTPRGIRSPTSILDAFQRPRIDTATTIPTDHGGAYDLLGNIPSGSAASQTVAPYLQRSNNLVRKFWSMPPAQRQQFHEQLSRGTPQRKAEFMRQYTSVPAPANDPLRTAPHVPESQISTAAHGPPRQIGMWTDFKYDPKPYLFAGGVGAGATGGVGYGGYKLYQHLYGNQP